ncbi:probable kinase CHARK [Oryza brachyantha]|uniref:probable kinase CHARK n=1 Tax=Oryza brachyantha TaxID=4533 RepID=UPI0007766359|nr:probable kinase CHARK [Oryza brachyantha]
MAVDVDPACTGLLYEQLHRVIIHRNISSSVSRFIVLTLRLNSTGDGDASGRPEDRCSCPDGIMPLKVTIKMLGERRHRERYRSSGTLLIGKVDSFNSRKLLLDSNRTIDLMTKQQHLGSCCAALYQDSNRCVVHGDIKPANVMLDASRDAKLGDFGLARLAEHGAELRTTQIIAGTLGYIDPEFVNSRRPSTESDVYSLGGPPLRKLWKLCDRRGQSCRC